METGISGAWLTTNRSCNNKCSFCYAQNAKGNDMDIEDAKRCIKALHEMGISHLILIGGEPTIYQNIIPLIEYATSVGMNVSMATNGRKFSDSLFSQKIARAGLSSVNISLKGSNEEEYLTNTHCKGFIEAIKGYKNLNEVGIKPIISYVITTNDVNKIKNLISSVVENNLDNLLFQFVKPVISPDSSPIMNIRF